MNEKLITYINHYSTLPTGGFYQVLDFLFDQAVNVIFRARNVFLFFVVFYTSFTFDV